MYCNWFAGRMKNLNGTERQLQFDGATNSNMFNIYVLKKTVDSHVPS
jgi:hypothetical protein